MKNGQPIPLSSLKLMLHSPAPPLVSCTRVRIFDTLILPKQPQPRYGHALWELDPPFLMRRFPFRPAAMPRAHKVSAVMPGRCVAAACLPLVVASPLHRCRSSWKWMGCRHLSSMRRPRLCHQLSLGAFTKFIACALGLMSMRHTLV